MRFRLVYFLLLLLLAAAAYDIVTFFREKIAKRKLRKGKSKFRGKKAIVINGTSTDGQAVSLELMKCGMELCITGDDQEALNVFKTVLAKRGIVADTVMTKGRTTQQIADEIVKTIGETKIGAVALCQRIDGSWCGLEPIDVLEALEKLSSGDSTPIPTIGVVHSASVLASLGEEREGMQGELCRKAQEVLGCVEGRKGAAFVFGDESDIDRVGTKQQRRELSIPNRTLVKEMVEGLVVGHPKTIYEYEEVGEAREKSKKKEKKDKGE